jgi:hypothetical protein
MLRVPTLYKARNVPTKQQVCAICVDRTRGRTVQVGLTHGVTIWLCVGHASPDFQYQRGGRDFVLTLSRLWAANGCLSVARQEALEAHLRSIRARPERPRPGSYAWPELRAVVERAFQAGRATEAVLRAVRRRYGDGPARPPSRRTIQRWRQQRRWVAPP